MNRYFFFFVVSGFISSCVSQEQSIVSPEEVIPQWVLNPPKGYYSDCAQVFDNNILQAKKVAKSKVQAAYLRSKETQIQSSSMISETSSMKGTSDQSIETKTLITSTGQIDHTFTVIKSANIQSSNDSKYCVMMGKIH